MLAGVTDPDYQVETGRLLSSEGREEYVWNTGDPLGLVLVLPCSVITVNGKLQQPYPGRNISGQDPSRMKV